MKFASTLLLVMYSITVLALPVFAMAKRPELSGVQTKKIVEPIDLEKSYRMAHQRSETVEISREEIRKTEAKFLQSTGDAIGDVNFVVTDFDKKRWVGELGIL
jgi:hypothetical protein